MKFHTNLAAIARRTGFPVTEVRGWQGRGDGGMADRPQAVVCHHTAGPSRGDYPSLKVVTNGRADLRNSLAAFGLGRSGRIFVIAAGESWHAGKVRDKRFNNSHAFGIEAENTGVGERWSPRMLESYARLCAELCRAFNIAPSMVRGHKEVCTPAGRKIDPAGIDMNAFRRVVAARLGNQSQLKLAEEDDMAGALDEPMGIGRHKEDTPKQLLDAIMSTTQMIPKLIATVSALQAAVAADPKVPVTQEQLDKAVASGLAGAKITLTQDSVSLK